MTQRTERTDGMMTYVEETRVVEIDVLDAVQQRVKVAEVTHHHRGNYSVYTFSNQGLTRDELRALRDAITVMLGEETGANPLKDVIDSAEREAGERIIARLKASADLHSGGSQWADGRNVGLQLAGAIVREECGVAE